ncbi:hypothetical protein niasHT_037341 [Heterodera trifolii]|uniref:Effector protein n=1 Tax=Heterodera trifolii TaxID=157864 RepID=A0ABD2J517_9BILA
MQFFLIQQIVPLLLLLTVVIFSIADVNDDEEFLNKVITINDYYGKTFTGTYRELRELEHNTYCTGKDNQSDCINEKQEKRAWDCMWENGICVPGAVRPLDDPPPKNNGKKKQRKNKKKTNGKKRFRFF